MAGFYSSRVNAQVVAAPPVRPPLGVGELVSALGRTAGAVAEQTSETDRRVSAIDAAIAEREKARARDAASANFSTAAAKAQGDFDRFKIDHGNDADFESKANAKIETDNATLRGMLGNDAELIQRYEPILTRMAENSRTATASHAAAVRSAASKASFNQFDDEARNAIQTDPSRVGEFADLAATRINEDSSIPAALKPGLVQVVRGEYEQVGLGVRIDSGDAAAVADLRAGKYDGTVSAEAKAALRKRADIYQREAQAAQERAGKQAQEDARGEIASIKVMIENGDDPGNARIAAAAAAAKATGLPEDELLTAGYLVEGAARARVAQSMPTPVLRDRVRSLEALEAAGKLNDAGRRELGDYGPMLDARDKKHGAKIEALDQADAIGELRGLKRSERVAIGAQGAVAARRVVLADLAEDSIATISVGAGLRKDRPNDFMPKAVGKADGDPKLAEKAFRDALGQRVVNSLGEAYQPLLNAALDHYVGSQASAGDQGGWNPTGFKKSMRVVFGGSKRRDGTYQGGLDAVRDRITVLPSKMTADDLDRGLSRLDFGKRGAIYSDGRPARTRDVMAGYRIVVDHQDDNGMLWYRFEGADGKPLMRKGGGRFLEGFPG